MSQIPFSPPPTIPSTSNSPSLTASSPQVYNHNYITPKSHRLRTSPIPGEGSTYIPVVKFSQPFTERNALRATKPVYETATVEPAQQGDIVVPRGSARTHGWTISITSSAPTEDEIQVEVQRYGDVPPLPSHVHSDVISQREERARVGSSHRVQPKVLMTSPKIPAVPTLAHDRVVITEGDYANIRTKAVCCLVLGLVFPPLWLMMGWGHVFDQFILPSTGDVRTREQIVQTYVPYRRVASVLAGVIVLAAFAGIIVGGLALGGVIA